MQNLVSQIKGRTQTEGVQEQGIEKTNSTEDGQSDRRLEKTV
jgi:hypothetical protein